MPSDVVNRKTLRQALASAMTTDLVGPTHAAQKLYRYKKSKFDAETTHLIVLTSGPADRSRQAQPTRAHSLIEMEIWIFVLYSADGWTEEQSEDKRDDMEKEISDWILDNADNSELWQGLRIVGQTEPDEQPIGGKTYRTEVITVELEEFSE
jgi:hypothetical protein